MRTIHRNRDVTVRPCVSTATRATFPSPLPRLSTRTRTFMADRSGLSNQSAVRNAVMLNKPSAETQMLTKLRQYDPYVKPLNDDSSRSTVGFLFSAVLFPLGCAAYTFYIYWQYQNNILATSSFVHSQKCHSLPLTCLPFGGCQVQVSEMFTLDKSTVFCFLGNSCN